MPHLVTGLLVLLVAVGLSEPALAQQPSPDPSAQPPAERETRSPWLLVPMFSSSPKLGTALGGLGAYMHMFDPASRVSLFGATYRYTSTHSQIFSAFARTSSGADHHRIVLIAAFGLIKNDYDDYLGRPAAEDRRPPEGLRGAVPLSCEGRLVHWRPGKRRQLSGAGRDRGRRSRA